MNRIFTTIVSFFVIMFSFNFLESASAKELNLITNTPEYRLKKLGDQAYSENNYKLAIDYYLDASKASDNLGKTNISLALLRALIADENTLEAKKTLRALGKNIGFQPQLKYWIPLYQANIAIAEKKYHKALSILNDFTYENNDIDFSNSQQKNLFLSPNEMLNFKLDFLNSYAFVAQAQEEWQLATDKYRTLIKLATVSKKNKLIYSSERNFIYCTIKDSDLAAANTMLSLLLQDETKLTTSQFTELQFLQLFALAKTPGINYQLINERFQKIEDKLTFTTSATRYEIDLFIANKIKRLLTLKSSITQNNAETKIALTFLHDAYKIAPTTPLRKNVLKLIINDYVMIKDFTSAITWSNLYINFYDDSNNNSEVDYMKLQLASLYRLNNDLEKAALLYKELSISKVLSTSDLKKAALNGGNIFLKLKQYSLATNLFELIAANNNLNKTTREQGQFLVAKTMQLNKEFLKAANCFNNLANTSKKYHDQALLNSLACYVNTKNRDLATTAFKKIMSSVADNEIKIQSQFFYCQLATITGDFKKAAIEYRDFVAKFPTHKLVADALFNGAELYFKMQEYNKANDLYQRFEQLYPNHKNLAKALYKSVYCNFFVNNFTALESSLLQLKQRFPSNKYTIAAIFYINNYYQENAQYDKALQNLQFLINNKNISTNNHALAIYELANIFLKQQQFSTAIKNLEQLILKYPTSDVVADALFLLGNINSIEKRYIKAIEYFNQTLQRRPMTEMAVKCILRIADCYYLLELKNANLIRLKTAKKVNNKTNNKANNKIPDNENINKASIQKTKEKGFYLALAIKNYEQLISGTIPQLNKNVTTNEIMQETQNQALYSVGRCYELKKDKDKSLIYYQTVINNYILRLNNNVITSEKYFIKSAYAAIDILLGQHTPKAALATIKIYQQLQYAKINIGDNYNNLINDLKKKFRL